MREVDLAFDGKPLLQRIGLSIRSRSDDVGDFVVIEGPSGSGKSSLLRLLNRLVEPTAGQMLVDGVIPAAAQTPALRRQVALLQQTPVIMSDTVRVNLLHGDAFATQSAAKDEAQLRRDLDRVGLEHIALDDAAEPLSVGQRQRLALARLLRVQPRFLLADEPTSALDDESRRVVLARLESLCVDGGMGVVLVTHRQFTPARITPRRLRLQDGHLKEV
ncbi:MAG: ATP-binding cassette domain-containing protein [Gemmatimonadetes bacterium]|nr:ATP-binding cassette domain-containing protein [Gemmatimonadota bacterium]MBT4613347.1 ATP-binding cassette domain-containing protein [Gemmatimonadota bacterium]MBT5059354.1 ATP-binding cassette domain-containing protein [Gemmatimonadota bacterium]MBT5141516.1 ATP-binding cassette domain-containing protein [Gemmatimonadota bacterium]MBT5588802.1 ATP-binding cassette domain-containing protein [Gemmatimonadota bacterium]